MVNEAVQKRIEELLSSHDIFLFMKGTKDFPQCGFSAKILDALNLEEIPFESFNVLDDFAIREGIKIYGDWPTLPQLYYKGKLIGGCDIILELSKQGELKKTLGLD